MMLLKIVKSKQGLTFLGGMLAATVGVKLLKHEKTKKYVVKAVARGMQLRNEATEAFNNAKEEAIDLYWDLENKETDKEDDEQG